MNISFSITPDEVDERLDHILVKRYTDFSRSLIQKSIKEGSVMVNEKQVAPHYFVRAGETITGTLAHKPLVNVVANASVPLNIIHEEEDFLIVNKPAGLVVHQSDAHPEPDTLANALLAHAKQCVGVGDAPERPGIVHRLDAPVSGVLIVAKTQPMFQYLKSLFAEHRIEKVYTALVYGTLSQPEGTITFPVARSKTKQGRMAARPRTANSISHNAHGTNEEREAVTHYTVIQQYQHHALLEVRPKTGRMHQIRVHCSAIGHPIVGDTMYAGKELHPERAPRLFLHATELHFKDQNGKQRDLIVPLPQTFHNFIDELTTNPPLSPFSKGGGKGDFNTKI